MAKKKKKSDPKGKLPYIPIYIGDWEQDVNTISIEAEGALLKLTFKLWKSPVKGEIEMDFNQLSKLWKIPVEEAVKILTELHKNDVLIIEFLPENKAKIISRRMRNDRMKSLSAKERGKEGGRGNKKEEKLPESYLKAKAHLFPESESDIDNESEVSFLIKKGALQKNSENLIYPFDSKEFMEKWDVWMDFRKKAMKPYHTFSNVQAALQKLSHYDEKTAIAVIQQSLENNWINFHELKISAVVPVGKIDATLQLSDRQDKEIEKLYKK